MTVNLVRVYAEWPDGYTIDQIQNAVNDWIDNHARWTDDWVSHEVTAANTEYDTDKPGVDFVAGDFRFTTDDTKAAILDDAEARLQQYVAWYRLGYHVCRHDETGECGPWDTREYGTIPAGIPDFT